ncbi:MAG: hypothetical protein OXH39_14420 [Candidatus Poribacteria bacterium]|nr:hypothetical protein [Candidatus Poribacteria bacterium]
MEENIEQPEPDASDFPSGRYDTVAKNVIRGDPNDLIRFSLGTQDAEVIRVLETEQPTVNWYRADSFIHARVRGKEVIVHLELQTHDSRQIPMPHRVAGYVGLGIRTFGIPIYSHVIYFHPDAGLNDPGEYVQDGPGYEITIKYKVIRLSEIEGQDILEAKLKGLIPFAPLMKPPEEMGSKEWLRHCIEVAETIPMDMADKPNYLASMAILCNVIFNFDDIREIIPEEILMQSDVVQYFKKLGIEQGIEQGARESIIEGILEALEVRFSAKDVEKLKPMLESVETLQRLKELRREVLRTYSLETFAQMLENGSGIEP